MITCEASLSLRRPGSAGHEPRVSAPRPNMRCITTASSALTGCGNPQNHSTRSARITAYSEVILYFYVNRIGPDKQSSRQAAPALLRERN